MLCNPDNVMHNSITLRRGLDLQLSGRVADNAPTVEVTPNSIAIVPDDFTGLTPKVVVKPGEKVVAGQPIIVDKNNTDIAVVSPVGGTVSEVVRGERRKVLRVVIAVEQQSEAPAADTTPIAPKDPASIRKSLMSSGVWAMMRQLPYDIVPDPSATPRDIFITTFDSAPLAAPILTGIDADDSTMAAGLKALLQLTPGNIYIGVRTADLSTHWIEEAAKMDRVCVTEFAGKHPAGLPSIQAALQAPVNKGETVWLTDAETLSRIGSVVKTGACSWSTLVALTGSEVETPCMIRTIIGAEIGSLISGRLKKADHHLRIISGNVLTGWKTSAEGFLRYPYRHITVIPEGDDVDEFMGWASMSPKKMSENRSFLSKLFGRKNFSPDARLNGGRRAMIMSGQYEKVMPTDIMPEQLIKAILSRDIDRMEALGIYEVTPADFALCEYIDPSKLELQKIVRQGLDYLRKELS